MAKNGKAHEPRNKTLTIEIDGEEVQAVQLPFEPVTEPWSIFDLPDGVRVRVRATVNRIAQVLDEHGEPARTAEGELLMNVSYNLAINVQEP